MRGKALTLLCLGIPAMIGGMISFRMHPSPAIQADDPSIHAHARAVFQHALPELDGSHLTVSLVEVRYGPGEGAPAHSHPCPVVVQVVEGALRVQIKGEPEAIYRAGQTFYEARDGVHQVSQDASSTEPVRRL